MTTYKVYGYLSDKRAIENGKKEIRDFCKKMKIKAPKFIQDDNVTGKIPYNERNLGKLIIPFLNEDDYLIIHEISSLSRNASESYALIAIFKKKKVNFCLVEENIIIKYNDVRTIETVTKLDFYILFAEIEQIRREKENTQLIEKIRLEK